jgi:hypothetical protein
MVILLMTLFFEIKMQKIMSTILVQFSFNPFRYRMTQVYSHLKLTQTCITSAESLSIYFRFPEFLNIAQKISHIMGENRFITTRPKAKSFHLKCKESKEIGLWNSPRWILLDHHHRSPKPWEITSQRQPLTIVQLCSRFFHTYLEEKRIMWNNYFL